MKFSNCRKIFPLRITGLKFSARKKKKIWASWWVRQDFASVWKFLKFTKISMENLLTESGWQDFFSHTNTFNSQWPLQSLLLRIYGWRLIVYAIFVCIRHASEANCFYVYRKLVTWPTGTKSLLHYIYF